MRKHVSILCLCILGASVHFGGCGVSPSPETTASKETDSFDAGDSSATAGGDDARGILEPAGGTSLMFSTLVGDADGDGVADDVDACPETGADEAVDMAGCSCAQLDTDGDGTNDCEDRCPLNPFKIEPVSEIDFAVSFDDPDMLFSDYYADVEALLRAVGQDWVQHFVAPRSVTIEMRVEFAKISTASAASATVVFVGTNGSFDVYEQGVAYEIRTGLDPNGPEPDAIVRIGERNLLEGRWWFDPDPAGRAAPVPGDRIDAYSTLLHEMGHVLAYNGWRDSYSGRMRGQFQSTYDELTVFDGENFFFVGDAAIDVYGGPLPETYGNCRHLANRPPRPGGDLLEQLMNGVANRRGWRRYISEVDLAVLADVGLPVRGPDDAGMGDCDGGVLGLSRRSRPPRLGPAPPLRRQFNASAASR